MSSALPLKVKPTLTPSKLNTVHTAGASAVSTPGTTPSASPHPGTAKPSTIGKVTNPNDNSSPHELVETLLEHWARSSTTCPRRFSTTMSMRVDALEASIQDIISDDASSQPTPVPSVPPSPSPLGNGRLPRRRLIRRAHIVDESQRRPNTTEAPSTRECGPETGAGAPGLPGACTGSAHDRPLTSSRLGFRVSREATAGSPREVADVPPRDLNVTYPGLRTTGRAPHESTLDEAATSPCYPDVP
ncbi:hypothetical protein FA95DRAFT_1578045 [Auriscalpium vulgare]|uniref:Uncharacterized protein n=1 Tax=Auriscalpium vulgare TaxID=40419 RepID=A0ACB8R4M9_9AGAM|nr:hypothetical protein FA95DRAFT_1578045 [Auriscalpium vulgare]